MLVIFLIVTTFITNYSHEMKLLLFNYLKGSTDRYVRVSHIQHPHSVSYAFIMAFARSAVPCDRNIRRNFGAALKCRDQSASLAKRELGI